MKLTIDTIYTSVDFNGDTLLREKVHGMVHRTVDKGGMGVMQDGAIFNRAYKAGVWDGISDFYDFKEDKFHTGLLQQFLSSIRELQTKDPSITYEIEDVRPAPILHHDSIDEEIVLGNGDEDPITLRDYQYDSVKKIFEEQVGIINISTNGGKTEVASGIMQQILPHLKRGERIAFFTHSKEIMHQSAERIAKRLGMPERQIGKIGDGKFDIKNKQVVFVMIPTLVSALKDPKKGVKFTPKERAIKMIAEDIAPKFRNTVNTRQLMRNYIKNCKLTTNVWLDVKDQLEYIAYDNKFTDKSAQMHLNKYIVEFEKIMEKKNKGKYKKYKETIDFLESVRVMIADECLVGDTLIMKEDGGWGFISDIIEGDTIEGGTVSNLIKRKSPITTIQTSHTLIEGSPTHPTFVVSKDNIQDFKKGIKTTDGFEEKPLMMVKEGDYLPVLYRLPHTERTAWTPDQLAFVALIMADGHLDKDSIAKEDGRVKKSNMVKVNVSKDKEWYLHRFTKGAKSFNKDYKVKHSYDCRGNLTVRSTERELKDTLENTFSIPRGKKSNKIYINEEIQYAPLDSIKSFIHTYFSCEGNIDVGDGDYRKNPSYRVSINTVSKPFALGMSLLLRKFGILPSIQVIKRSSSKHNTVYRLTLSGSMFNKYMDEIGLMPRKSTKHRNVSKSQMVFVGDYILSKVQGVEHSETYQDVYDFTTTSHTFVANGALTHNCHHGKSDTWYSSLSLCSNATYRVGLTGTVDKKDKMGWQRLQAIFSAVVVKVSNEFLIDRGISSKPTIRLLPIQQPRDLELIGNYMEAYKRGIVENDYRNKAIVSLVVAYKKKRPGGILISVKEIEHGDRILEMLRELEMDVEFIHGGSDDDHRSGQLERFSKGQLDILIASTIIDEGVDMKSIGCMILAAGGKSMRQQLQRIGRGLRLNGIDGNSVMVFDFYDQTNKYLLGHSNERIKIFKAENFDVKIMGE